MTSLEEESAINHIQLSGVLLTDVERKQWAGGYFLTCTMLAPKPGRKDSDMRIGVTMFPGNNEAIQTMLKLRKNNSVVVTGRLSMREYHNRTYLSIIAESIE